MQGVPVLRPAPPKEDDMKAIIIEDVDARALLESLELTALRAANHWPNNSKATKEAIEEAHGIFHYVVCRWLQDHGANVVR